MPILVVDFLRLDSKEMVLENGHTEVSSLGVRFVFGRDGQSDLSGALRGCSQKFWDTESKKPVDLETMLEIIFRHLRTQSDDKVFSCATPTVVMWVRVTFTK